VLPSLFRRSHIAHYAPAVSLTRRLPESSMILGIKDKFIVHNHFIQHLNASVKSTIYNHFRYKAAGILIVIRFEIYRCRPIFR
jgi:hypothetical protein